MSQKTGKSREGVNQMTQKKMKIAYKRPQISVQMLESLVKSGGTRVTDNLATRTTRN